MWHVICSVTPFSAILPRFLRILRGAAEHYQRSVKFWRKTNWRGRCTNTHTYYSPSVGDSGMAGPMLGEALALATDMGMNPLMERILSKWGIFNV